MTPCAQLDDIRADVTVRSSWYVLWSWILVAGVLGACVRPPPPPPSARQTHLGLRLSAFELANGVRGVLVHDPGATEVQVTMRYQVGSVDDPPEHPGMAHLVSGDITQQELATALGTFLGRVARRDGKRPRHVPPVAMAPSQLKAPAPIDDPALVFAWPLPVAHHERTKVRAVARSVRS